MNRHLPTYVIEGDGVRVICACRKFSARTRTRVGAELAHDTHWLAVQYARLDELPDPIAKPKLDEYLPELREQSGLASRARYAREWRAKQRVRS